MKEYEEGYDSYSLGISTCPYDVGTKESKAWHSGYIDASLDILESILNERNN